VVWRKVVEVIKAPIETRSSRRSRSRRRISRPTPAAGGRAATALHPPPEINIQVPQTLPPTITTVTTTPPPPGRRP
jgi:hypothetical protein